MAVEIKYSASEKILQDCSKRIIDLIPSSISSLLFISGGSCLALLPNFPMLIQNQHKDVSKLTISFVDERFDPLHSNFVLMTRDYLPTVQALKQLGVSFIDTSPHEKDQYTMAYWFETQLVRVLDRVKQSNGTIITLLGMGQDGHIAGILPHPVEKEEFYSRFVDVKRHVVGYDAQGKNQYDKRFTLTFSGLELADKIVVCIRGKDKKSMLQKIVSTSLQLNEVPATFLQQTRQSVEIFTDIVL